MIKDDPIVEELHRHREELFREFGNDPEALVKHLQEKERSSGRLVFVIAGPTGRESKAQG